MTTAETPQPFIQTIRLRNFLSYGTEGQEIALEPLNVLIGPNASGKSNLIDAFGLLRATPGDLAAWIRTGGGVSEWLWKGRDDTPVAEMDVTVRYPSPPGNTNPLRYWLNFTMTGQRLEIVGEGVESKRSTSSIESAPFFYRFQGGRSVLNVRTVNGGAEQWEARNIEDLALDQSILSQRKDPDQYPELTYLSHWFSEFRLHRPGNAGRDAPLRLPQKADLPDDYLAEDGGNLGLVLNSLQQWRGSKQKIKEYLRKFYEGADDVVTKIRGGTVQVLVHERGMRQPIPATRLSDGTLRYLMLLTALLHPNPPPLVCIEEPELGLHPDILPTVAHLLIEASERMQLVVTTHSDDLVSAMADTPGSIVVCDRDDGGTRLQRLEPARLQRWLEKYSLGELWRKGELGGTRW